MVKEKFTFFWKANDIYSQWHPSNFEEDDIDFMFAEQYMMYWKAKIFGDERAMDEILATDSPREMKRIGRRVQNFNSHEWDIYKFHIVYWGNYLKFSQNPKLLDELMSTKGTILVEASPYDRIWGIGLKEDDPRAQDRNTWKGQNLLGQALTILRNHIEKGYLALDKDISLY